MADRVYLEQLTRELTEQGQLLEAGWITMRLAAIPLSTPADRLEQLRMAFFAGAQHLFGSLMNGVLDPEAEPTEADMRRLDLIDRELKTFIREFELRHGPIKGRG